MVDNVVQASQNMSLDELRRFRVDPQVKAKMLKSPLLDLFLTLGDMMETDSEESLERTAAL